MNRQKLILFIAVILLVLSVFWSYMNWPRQKTVSVLKYAPGQQSVPASAAFDEKSQQDDGRILNLAQLDREQGKFKGYRRNLFKPLWSNEMAGMKQKAAAFKPALPPPLLLPPPVAPVEPPRQELIKFTFMGFLDAGNRKTVFLTKDNAILLVRAGETFADRFQAVQITDQALTIKVIDSNEEIIVPLIENQPLR